jgi:kynurenine formamidase
MSESWHPSRYGADDRLGAGNELTPAGVLDALRIPRTGRVIELAQVTTAATPVIAPRVHQQSILAHESSESSVTWQGRNGFTALQERVVTSFHVGCHLDGLGHVGIRGRYYNGLRHADIYGAGGLRELGIENVRPWLCRGVLLDAAASAGTDQLAGGHEITAAELSRAEQRSGTTVRAGDAVIIHTGWSALCDEQPASYAASEPGIGSSGADWLTERRVSLVGLDNWGCDVFPNPDPELFFPAHQHLLTRSGTYILENIWTAELVATGAAEFLFVLSPSKSQGATAAMVAPLAVI